MMTKYYIKPCLDIDERVVKLIPILLENPDDMTIEIDEITTLISEACVYGLLEDKFPNMELEKIRTLAYTTQTTESFSGILGDHMSLIAKHYRTIFGNISTLTQGDVIRLSGNFKKIIYSAITESLNDDELFTTSFMRFRYLCVVYFTIRNNVILYYDNLLSDNINTYNKYITAK